MAAILILHSQYKVQIILWSPEPKFRSLCAFNFTVMCNYWVITLYTHHHLSFHIRSLWYTPSPLTGLPLPCFITEVGSLHETAAVTTRILQHMPNTAATRSVILNLDESFPLTSSILNCKRYGEGTSHQRKNGQFGAGRQIFPRTSLASSVITWC